MISGSAVCVVYIRVPGFQLGLVTIFVPTVITSCPKVSGDHVFTNSSDTAIGSKVKITCESGYKIVGDTDTVICQASGVWSPAIPTCTVDDKGGLTGGSGMIT